MTRILDLFCGAGGAAMGYHQAGYEVVGVDINPQPRYPYEFHQADAIEYVTQHGREFDVIHASPPCQTYSQMSNCRPGLADTYPDLIDPTRAALDSTGLPYVIENVVGSSVRPDLMLCGLMFGRQLYRHRVFESNQPLESLPHFLHTLPAAQAGHWRPGYTISIAGNASPVWLARQVMEIDWMSREELSEAIPPYYTEYIGNQLRQGSEGAFAQHAHAVGMTGPLF